MGFDSEISEDDDAVTASIASRSGARAARGSKLASERPR